MSGLPVTLTAVANTQEQPAGREPGTGTGQDPASAGGDGQAEDVPLLPVWIVLGGWIPLSVAGVLAIVACVRAGTSYGAADGWILFLSLSVPPAAWLWCSYTWRAAALALRRRLELRARITIAEIDRMRWQDFELVSVRLLKYLGLEDVTRTRQIRHVKSVDITATVRRGRRAREELFECKHRSGGRLEVGAVNEMIGRLSTGMYAGMPLTIITNAVLSSGAREQAAAAGIDIIDRGMLIGLLAREPDAAGSGGPPGQPAAGSGPGYPASWPRAGAGHALLAWFRARWPETRLATGTTCGCVLVLIITVLQMAVAGPQPAAPPGPAVPVSRGSRPARTPPRSAPAQKTPDAVARAFFSAISAHDWPAVWRLGGKNIGRGPYSTYPGMISGYRGTIRDAPVAVSSSGDTVSGRFLAYANGRPPREYSFTYVVRNGEITSARQRAVASAG